MDIYFDPRLLTVPSASKTSGSTAANVTAAGTSFRNALNQQEASITAPSTLENIFAKASQTYGVPENMLKAVAKAESNFQPDCVSSAGASGIMQLMPSTAKEYGITDILDPEQNIMGGARELAADLKHYHGNVKLALAGYNAGCGNVDKYGGVPPFAETQNYVNKVMSLMGQNLEVPSMHVPASVSGNGVNTSGLAQLAATDDTADLASDTNFTYQDYQMFVSILIHALENGWESDTSGTSGFASKRWY